MKAATGPWTMVAGYILFGFMPGALKASYQAGWPPAHAVLIRFVIAGLGIAALALATGQNFKPVNRSGLLLRGVLGGAAVFTFFIAVQRCGSGLGTLLNYTHSLWANILGALFMRHRPSRKAWALLVLAFAGLLLISEPWALDLAPGHRSGLLIGLLSGFLGGAAVVTIKELRQTDNSLMIVSALSLGGLAFSVPAVLITPASSLPWSSPFAWLAISSMGLLSLGGQLLFTQGFKNTPVALASTLSLLTPVMALALGSFFFQETLRPSGFWGAGLILIACLVAAWDQKNRRELKLSKV